eukprot:4307953-Amphidinium_carterae.1
MFAWIKAQKKVGRERIEAVASLIHDAMQKKGDDNCYQADETCCTAQMLLKQSSTCYKQSEQRGYGKVEAKAKLGGEKGLEDRCGKK